MGGVKFDPDCKFWYATTQDLSMIEYERQAESIKKPAAANPNHHQLLNYVVCGSNSEYGYSDIDCSGSSENPTIQ